MARFTTRIQLEDATESDYQSLQTQLEQDVTGIIKKTVTHSKRTLSSNSEFSLEGNITIQEVTAVVSNAAAKTGKKYSFTIIRNKPLNSN